MDIWACSGKLPMPPSLERSGSRLRLAACLKNGGDLAGVYTYRPACGSAAELTAYVPANTALDLIHRLVERTLSTASHPWLCCVSGYEILTIRQRSATVLTRNEHDMIKIVRLGRAGSEKAD